MTAPQPSKTDGALLVVSNRLPYNLPREDSDRNPKRNVGGLVNSLEPVLAVRRGSWIGWDGASLPSASAVSSVIAQPRTFRTHTGVDLYGVPLSEREVSRYYHGLSNRTLWPLFHNILDKAVFESEDYSTYVRVNQRFAETVMAVAGKQDRVWVHDYHLMLVPAFLRQLGFHGRIDFFLHIPFPAPEIFRSLPWREELIAGLLAADTVVFHIESYRENFLRTAEILTDSKIVAAGTGEVVIEHSSRSTVTGVAPIGVDVDEFQRIVELPSVEAKVSRIRRAYEGRKILFSADRLDYTKGIKERLLAVERLLSTHPSAPGTFTMLQVLVPSRHQVEEYRALKREIDEEVGRINGEHGREGWVPIHYRYTALNREELVAHYRAASVALVTPLRDGLNLVAPEFVACRTDQDGVLVLSEFAGVAELLRDAVRVNPYDIEGCAEAIHTAMEMDPTERRFRMAKMHEQVGSNTISNWAERCLSLSTGVETKDGKSSSTAVRSEPPLKPLRAGLRDVWK